MKKLLLISVLALAILACNQEDCYECKLSSTSTEENCSNVFTTPEIDSLRTSCEMRGGEWKMK